MIRHTILFKLKAAIPKIELEKLFTSILTLTNNFQGVASITGGTCHFQEFASPDFTHGISIDFDNRMARDAFLKNTVWSPVIDHIIEMTQGGSDGVINFDFGD